MRLIENSLLDNNNNNAAATTVAIKNILELPRGQYGDLSTLTCEDKGRVNSQTMANTMTLESHYQVAVAKKQERKQHLMLSRREQYLVTTDQRNQSTKEKGDPNANDDPMVITSSDLNIVSV